MAEQALQLLLHVDQIKQAVCGGRREPHGNIDVAIGPEVVSQYGTKDVELADLPPQTEVGDLLVVHRNLRCHGATVIVSQAIADIDSPFATDRYSSEERAA